MATVSVRLDEALVEEARKAANSEFRTIQGQLEFWIKVGQAAIDNPDLPGTFVAGLIMAMEDPTEDREEFLPHGKPLE